MMTEVDIGDILRYDGSLRGRNAGDYAVCLVTEHIEDYIYNVLVLETNMTYLEGPWSFDTEILNMCTKLA